VGKIAVTEFMSLDGIISEPHHWSFPYGSEEIGKFKTEELFATDALLLGRTTYLNFADSWPGRSGDFADKFNSLPKYVVSANMENATWSNSQIIKGDLPGAIAGLKQQYTGDVVIHGSAGLVKSLAKQGLVDEYRLLLYPIALGSGLRLFDGAETKLSLVETKLMGNGVIALIYEPAK
jgi:dihydrofolate reductase